MSKEEKNNLSSLFFGILITEAVRFIFKNIPTFIQYLKNMNNGNEIASKKTLRKIEKDFSTNHDWNTR